VDQPQECNERAISNPFTLAVVYSYEVDIFPMSPDDFKFKNSKPNCRGYILCNWCGILALIINQVYILLSNQFCNQSVYMDS